MRTMSKAAIKVLIACEFSGIVRNEFRKLGFDAWSCDLLPAEDNSPYHIQIVDEEESEEVEDGRV